MRTFTEKEAEEFLENEKFDVSPRALAKNKNELKKIKLKFPWAMKVCSNKIVHKAKVGGIFLNIKNLEEANTAFDKISKIPNFEEVLIQEMVEGEELIIGVKKTPEFNQVIMLGKGGSNVEEEKDVSFRVLPINQNDAKELIQDVKFYKIIKEKNINQKLIIQTLIKISDLIKKYPKIIELDLNPLKVTSEKLVIVDARIIFDD
jgi:hypothetical protein